MLLITLNYVPGKEIEALGIVSGMKTLVGVELSAYTEMLNETRQIATKRMVDEAEVLGADAVINIRYGSASMMQGAAEVVVYGTAVKIK